MNPTVLPQTFVAISNTDQNARGPGRVTLSNRLRTAKRAVDDLQAFLDKDSSPASGDVGSLSAFTAYTSLRMLMMDAVGSEATNTAIQETSQNLRNAEEILIQEGVAVEVDPELRRGQLLGLVRTTME